MLSNSDIYQSNMPEYSVVSQLPVYYYSDEGSDLRTNATYDYLRYAIETDSNIDNNETSVGTSA